MYDDFQLDDEEDKDSQSGDTLITGAGPGASAQQSGQSRVSDGTGEFTAIGKYIDANRDRHQGEQLAGKVGEDVGQAETAQSELGNTFRTQADAATKTADQGLLDEVKTSPTAVAGDAEKKKAFEAERDATYQGPSLLEDLDSWSGVQKKTSAAKEASDASKTETGRTALLDKFYGRPTYTGGEKALDQQLVATDDRAPQAFQSVQNRGDAAASGLDALSQSSRAYADAAKAKTAATSAAARGAVDQGVASRKGAIDDKVKARQAEYDRVLPAVQGALSNLDLTQLSPELRQSLGLDTYDSPVYDVDPSQYLHGVSRDQINPNTVAGQNDVAEMQALAELGGFQNTYLTHPESAGTMDDEALFNFDRGTFDQAVKNRGAQYQDAANRPVAWPATSGPGTGNGVMNVIQIANQLTGGDQNVPANVAPAEGIRRIDDAIARLRSKEPSPGYADWAWKTYLAPARAQLEAAANAASSSYQPTRTFKR
jgi:hypothetical protein